MCAVRRTIRWRLTFPKQKPMKTNHEFYDLVHFVHIRLLKVVEVKYDSSKHSVFQFYFSNFNAIKITEFAIHIKILRWFETWEGCENNAYWKNISRLRNISICVCSNIYRDIDRTTRRLDMVKQQRIQLASRFTSLRSFAMICPKIDMHRSYLKSHHFNYESVASIVTSRSNTALPLIFHIQMWVKSMNPKRIHTQINETIRKLVHKKAASSSNTHTKRKNNNNSNKMKCIILKILYFASINICLIDFISCIFWIQNDKSTIRRGQRRPDAVLFGYIYILQATWENIAH